MSNTEETTLQDAGYKNGNLTNLNFPELPLFIISALLFLNFGIILGSINAFRVGQIFDPTPFDFYNKFIPQTEVHQTHWTSTLLGGVSLIMMGQIFFFLSQINEKRNPFHLGTLVVLVLWFVGIFGSYLSVWNEDKDYIDISVLVIKIAATLFLLLVLSFFANPTFRENIKNHFSMYYLIAATVWLWFAVIMWFDIRFDALDRMFLFTYIYGFFSLALFGSLSFVLPILTGTKQKSQTGTKVNFVLLNLAGAVIIYDLYRTIELEKNSTLFDLLGPFLWGLAGFFFIIWVFDLIYKSSADPSLIAILIALLMFSFFVMDTLMKNLFTNWVDRSHFHFMFIGTLLITIIAIGSRVIVLQYSPKGESIEVIETSFKEKFHKSHLIRLTGTGITIISVALILLGFTLQNYTLSGWSGIGLFFGLIIVEITMIYQMISVVSKKEKE